MCQKLREYEKVCQKLRENEKVCQKLRKYEVSDAEVVWQVSGRSPNGLFAELDTYTLNRYSGQLSVDRSFSNGMNTPQPPVICQKSQKQF